MSNVFQRAADRKKFIRMELESLDIRSSSIFPDLEHLAKDLETKEFVVTDPAM